MIVLVGESGCGKSTIENELVKKGYTKEIYHTTRSIRKGEIFGEDYHFVTEEQILMMNQLGAFAEFTLHKGEYYGITKRQCKEDSVVVVTPEGLEQLKNNTEIKLTSFYLYTSEEIREKRMLDRGDKYNKVLESIIDDREVYKNIAHKVDYIINTDYKTVGEISDKIIAHTEYRGAKLEELKV